MITIWTVLAILITIALILGALTVRLVSFTDSGTHVAPRGQEPEPGTTAKSSYMPASATTTDAFVRALLEAPLDQIAGLFDTSYWQVVS